MLATDIAAAFPTLSVVNGVAYCPSAKQARHLQTTARRTLKGGTRVAKAAKSRHWLPGDFTPMFKINRGEESVVAMRTW